MATPTDLSPALVNVVGELRRVIEGEVKADLARRLADRDMGATEIARLLGVSRNSVYRYLKSERDRPAP